ncbi:hypothetical protein ES288_A12G092400v1 [Gossypium darwinii]|nr:hypothetical protein ES288_A12G092400v1 [Gossypium darwinii]
MCDARRTSSKLSSLNGYFFGVSKCTIVWLIRTIIMYELENSTRTRKNLKIEAIFKIALRHTTVWLAV